jgi:large subunit ribosomal protein L29
MKIAEIKELSTKELIERVDAEVAAYDQKESIMHYLLLTILLRLKQQRRTIARMN